MTTFTETVIWYVCGILAGYLFGCINTAGIIAKAKGIDIRSGGSHNAGASNALVMIGKGAAVCTAVADMLKAFLPVFLLRHVIPVPESCAHLSVAAGAAVILGHMYPFWMQFRGGKGFASLLGLSLALDWRIFVAGIIFTAIVLLTVRYIVVATLFFCILVPTGWYLQTKSLPELLILLVPICIIVKKHFINLKRIREGTEIRFGDKKKTEPQPEGSGSAPEDVS